MEMRESADPAELFASFIADAGQEEVDRCYYMKLEKAPNEILWEVLDDAGTRIAFAGLFQVDPTLCGYRIGVFRAHRRKGWRKLIRAWIIEEAFKRPGVTHVRTSCQVGNPPQVVSMLKGHLDGSWMKLVEVKTEPKATLVFKFSRAEWEAVKAR
jgi:hypothetical protein